MARIPSLREIRPLARIVLFALGVYLFVVAQLAILWADIPDHRYGYYSSGAEDTAMILLGLAALLLLLLVFPFPFLAKRLVRADGFWGTRPLALNMAGMTFGLGVATFGCFCFGYGARQLAPVLTFLLPPAGTLVLATFEEGRRPLLAILLGIGAGWAYGHMHLAVTGHMGYMDHGEIVGFGLTALAILPLGYLLAKGMIVLVSGQLGGGGAHAPLLGGQPPLEVVRRGETLLVRLEAPGVRDVGGVQTRVEGDALWVQAELPSPPTEGLLFSSRRSGPYAVKARLPVPVGGQPSDVRVAHGVIEILLPSDPGPDATRLEEDAN